VRLLGAAGLTAAFTEETTFVLTAAIKAIISITALMARNRVE
jgi:hypothetical protein